jgi:chaperonin cofactor prefoldin
MFIKFTIMTLLYTTQVATTDSPHSHRTTCHFVVVSTDSSEKSMPEMQSVAQNPPKPDAEFDRIMASSQAAIQKAIDYLSKVNPNWYLGMGKVIEKKDTPKVKQATRDVIKKLQKRAKELRDMEDEITKQLDKLHEDRKKRVSMP